MPANNPPYPCPCCGYEVFSERPGSFDICPICFWEDDVVQLAFPDCAGGANHCSLIDGQRNYERFGACEQRRKGYVHPPENTERQSPIWRPLDPAHDRYLNWSNQADHALWDTVKNNPNRCDYYWLPEYWLARHQP